MRIIVLFLLAVLVGCSKNNTQLAKDGIIYAPISKEEVSRAVVPGISKTELLSRCGTRFSIKKISDVEEIEFILSSAKVKRYNEWYMSSFVVIVSNGVVLGWCPYSEGRLQ